MAIADSNDFEHTAPRSAGLGSGYQPKPLAPGYWLYDGLQISADLETHQFVMRYAKENIPRDVNVLDIATGEGALTRQLMDLGYPVSCTSWNRKCKLSVPTYSINLDSPFTPGEVGGRQYGLVCAIEIIEHVENPSAFLRSCASVLAPGGRLIVSTPNVESARARLQWLVRGVPSIFDSGEIWTNRHISMLWGLGLESLLALAGLHVIRRELLGGFGLPNSLSALPRRLAYRLVHAFCSGDTYGTTRLYVLTALGEVPRTLGPEDVC